MAIEEEIDFRLSPFTAFPYAIILHEASILDVHYKKMTNTNSGTTSYIRTGVHA